MNERIEQLAEQAEAWANEQNELYGVDYQQAFKERYAQLLLEDVNNIIQTEHYHHYADYADESKGPVERNVRKACCYTLVNISVNLEEHFGVEL